MKHNLPFISLILISTLLIFWRINDSYVAFTDELLFEEASYRMFASNSTSPFPNPSWLIPISNGQAWLEKPPLYFWLTAPIYWLFNQLKSIHPLTENLMPQGEFLYPWIRRFWTAIAGVAIVIFTYRITKLLSIFKNDPSLPPLSKGKSNAIPLLSAYLLLASPLFLATTKSASLDLTATAFMTGAIYFYLKEKLFLKFSKVTPPNLPLVRGGITLPAILIGFAILTRSFLALTPIGLIIIDQILNTKNRWPIKHWLIFFVTILTVTLPWHLAVYSLYPQAFLQTYLGFNLIHHAIQLTPGYQQTTPFYYFIELIRSIPWLLPFLTAGTLYLLYFKKRVNKKPFNNVTIRSFTNYHLLITWIAIPLTILTISSTRHSWYLVQITPPLAILMAYLLHLTYQTITTCSKCTTLKYLAQISFFTLTLASITTVLIASDPSAPPIKALRWARQNLPNSQPLFSYQQDFLPYTLLFQPHPVKIITNIRKLPANSNIFIADFHLNQALEQSSNLAPIQHFKLGSIYQTSVQK